VKRVREKVLPEMDEAWLKGWRVDSVEALRERVREDLARVDKNAETRRLRNEIAAFLISRTHLDLPETLVAAETRSAVYDIVRDVSLGGATREDIEKRRDTIFDAASRSATDRVKLRFVLGRIADAENVEVPPEDVQRRLEAIAARQGTTAQKLRDQLDERDGMETFVDGLRMERTIDYLLEQARITG
jgi:trigger factor